MKRFLAFLCILCMSMSIVGCSGKEEVITDVEVKDDTTKGSSEKKDEPKAAEKTHLIFWDANAGPNRTPYLEHLIDKFHEENTDIEVEYVGLPWKSAKEKYDVAIASGSTPDVGQVSQMWIANFAARGALLPLDDYFNSWEDKDQMIESYIDINRDAVADGKLYQIPNSANTGTMWYREDIFAEKGIEINTWEDFYKSVEKLTTDDMYGYSVRGGSGGIYQLIPYLFAYTGIDYYFNDEGRVFLREPEVIEAFERLVSIYGKYTPESDITNGYKEMVATFDTGKAAMIQHNLGSYGEHSKTLGEGKFMAMPLPVAANGKRVIVSEGAGGISVFANSEHPDASWKFLTSLVSKYGNSYWNENIGQLPTRKDVSEEQWMKDKKHIGVMVEAMAEPNAVVVRDSNFLPGHSSVMNEIGQPGFQAVLLGEMKPEELLNDMADAFEKEYQEYIANR